MADGMRDPRDPRLLQANPLLFAENAVLAFMQAVFSTYPANQNPSCFYYSDDNSATEVHIEGKSTDNLERVDGRPKIVAARGPVVWRGTGLGGNNFIGSANLSRMQVRKADVLAGSVGISCFSREDLEADRLAHVVIHTFKGFQDVLRRVGFLTVKGTQVGQRGIIKSDARVELAVTPVIVQTELTMNYNVEFNDPVKLRKIIVEVLTNC